MEISYSSVNIWQRSDVHAVFLLSAVEYMFFHQQMTLNTVNKSTRLTEKRKIGDSCLRVSKFPTGRETKAYLSKKIRLNSFYNLIIVYTEVISFDSE